MSRTPTPYQERRRRLEEARACLTRGAALLLDADFGRDNVPVAALLAATALVHLSAADHDGRDGSRVLELAQDLRRRATP